MVDVRKSLQTLRDEWESCKACELGVRRETLGGDFVFGEGCQRGIMFIGDGPDQFDEANGRPFYSEQHQVLRDVLAKLQFTDFYLTNLVTCRACEVMLDPATGTPRMRKSYGNKPALPMLRDQVPLPKQIEACQARLYEEIYLVDPILIVTLGALAAEVLLGRPVAITKDRGRTEHCTIPGATSRPVLTDKKKVWGHTVRGEYVLPTEPNPVRYLVLPTLHPSFVWRKYGDLGSNGPFRQFGADIRLAVKIYERYLVEALGADPAVLSNTGPIEGEANEPEETA